MGCSSSKIDSTYHVHKVIGVDDHTTNSLKSRSPSLDDLRCQNSPRPQTSHPQIYSVKNELKTTSKPIAKSRCSQIYNQKFVDVNSLSKQKTPQILSNFGVNPDISNNDQTLSNRKANNNDNDSKS